MYEAIIEQLSISRCDCNLLSTNLLARCVFQATDRYRNGMSTKGKVIKCLAAVAWEVNKPLVIEEIEVAPPKAGEVRIKIVATGVCATDDHALAGFFPGDGFPLVLGHEGAGIVESVGPDVTSVKEEDHVIPLYTAQCYQCHVCKSDKSNMCEKSPPIMPIKLQEEGNSRLTCKGKHLYQLGGISTFSQYTVVDEIAVAKISEKAPLDKVCLLGCGISTGYGAAINTAKVDSGSTCAIWGLGTVGLAAVMGCRERGAARIIGIDINPAKFEIAKKFGATEFVNPHDHKDPIQEVIKKLTNGGCDYTFECCGNVLTMRAAFEALHEKGAVCVVVGADRFEKEVSAFPLSFIYGKIWTGSCFGGWKSRDCVPKLVDSYLKKKLMVDDFVTHIRSLDRIMEALDLLKQGKTLRTVVTLF